ncbi:hypothetical protein [Microtetraspora malaysiensis]|uniref:Uncharacterized protein n=1 Tax=Microtetraspora malaysiensis TaxID=161358 RepID=A0ABW6T5S5_9ACTN
MTVDPRWVRLGDALKARRTELSRAVDADWRFRRRFVDAHHLDYRTTSDLEEHRRDNYTDATYRRVEAAYRWASGSIVAILEGGEPAALPLDAEPDEASREQLTLQRLQEGDFDTVMAAATDALERMSEKDRARAAGEMIRILHDLIREDKEGGDLSG